MRAKTADVAIVGAGVAGCALAIALKRNLPGLDICLLDRGQQTAINTGEDENVYADSIRPKIGETLPPQVIIPLQQLGLWEQFLAAAFLSCAGTLSLWGAALPEANEYIYSPYGNGWHLNRQQFDALMLNAAIQYQVRLISKAQFLDISQKHNGWQIAWRTTKQAGDEQQTITARFVVDASGRSARVAQRLGVNKQKLDRLIGIYRFYFKDQRSLAEPVATDSSTLIESAAQGWWYSARLPQHQQVVALMTDADIARTESYRTSTEFEQALAATKQISGHLDGLTADGEPIVSAAHTQRLDRMAGYGWLAVGDAAFTFDPLSSLGIFKALRMSLYAAYAIKDFFNAKDRQLIKYQAVADAEFNGYLAKRRDYYTAETRYSSELFWLRRLGSS